MCRNSNECRVEIIPGIVLVAASKSSAWRILTKCGLVHLMTASKAISRRRRRRRK
jgi:hypothetical protein